MLFSFEYLKKFQLRFILDGSRNGVYEAREGYRLFKISYT